jgi:membrane protein DedA with SNARE-associated domain
VDRVGEVLEFLGGLPPALTYAVLGLGAALENLIPPIPADTFVLLGGFLAARGRADPWLVWAATWALNVGSALVVYWIGHRHGRTFFEQGLGRHILNGHQLQRMQHFYRRFGSFAIFFTRFLPGLRAVVPAFAGVSRQRFLPVAFPLAAASAIWYGALVWLGATAGRNLDALLGALDDTNTMLLGVAALLIGAIVWWWIRTRGQAP